MLCTLSDFKRFVVHEFCVSFFTNGCVLVLNISMALLLSDSLYMDAYFFFNRMAMCFVEFIKRAVLDREMESNMVHLLRKKKMMMGA